MAVVEVQFAPKGGAEVKKTAKEIGDAFRAQAAAAAAAGNKNPIAFTLKQARELLGSFNGDLRKTLETLTKAGVASDDIVLLMKQLSRESVEARKQILGISQGLDETATKVKAAKAESDGFNVSLKTARTFAKVFNGDLEKTATHLRGAGASTNSIRVAMAALQVEAKGVNKETGEAAGKADSFTKSLKDGSLAAGVLKSAIAAVAKQLEDLSELAGVDSGKEGVKKSLDLDKKFNKFEKLVEVTGPEEAAQLRANVKRISLETNQTQETVLEAALGIQETKSAGREYLLENGGRGLQALLKHSYGDFQEGSEAVQSAQAAVVGAKDLGLTAAELAEGQNILAAGEKVGSLTGKGVLTKFGGVGANLSSLRKTTGLGALRESQAFAQVLGDVPGLSGNIDRVKVIGENVVGKLADTQTQERLKDVAGISTFKDGKLRPLADIAEDISNFRAKDPKNEQKLYEVFRDIQARQGVLGISTPERVAKLREYEKVDSAAGAAAISSGFVKRVFSLEGKLSSQQRQREADEYDELAGRAGSLLEVGRVSQQLHESPTLGFIADQGAELAKKGDIRSVLGGAAVYAASVASSYVVSNDPKNPFKYENAQRGALIDAQKAGGGTTSPDAQTNAQLLAIQAAAAKSGVNLDLSGNNPTITSTNDKGVKVQVEIKVDQEGKVSEVTSESKNTKTAAKGNTRKKTSTQR
jgi:hypothetical protein